MAGGTVASAVKILYLTRDEYPTFRVDIDVLFGKFLPSHNVKTTIVARRNLEAEREPSQAMSSILHSPAQENRYTRAIQAFIFDLKTAWKYAPEHDVVQARNKIITAVFLLAISRARGVKFCYWMSYPYPEDDLLRVAQNGTSMGVFRALSTWLRGHLSKFCLYRLVIPWSDGVFVQSKKMADDVRGLCTVDSEKLAVVPMGVDLEELDQRTRPEVNRIEGDLIAYIGAMDRARRVEFLFDALKLVVERHPGAVLLLIGDCIEPGDWRYLERRAQELGVASHIQKTGWLDRDQAWAYLTQAKVGVCALPDEFVFNSMSPTKAVEMLALGIPVVVTRHPDQGLLVDESHGGLVTPYDAAQFAEAVDGLLNDADRRAAMSGAGKRYIAENRSYAVIAERVANQYHKLAGRA